jgi:hypothetical protein
MAIFKREIFLNFGNNWNTVATKSVEKKGRWQTQIIAFF